MKTRQGFVSNSSSSSFIIGVDKIPYSVEEAVDVWFKEDKDRVSVAVQSEMFNVLKEMKIDLKRLRELADLKWAEIKALDNYEEDQAGEGIILGELSSEFYYKEEYSSGSWSSRNSSPIESWVNEEMEKRGFKKDDYRERYLIKNEWFDLPEVKEKFIQYVEKFITHFEKYKLFMIGEFCDDTSLGSEIEHDFNWEGFFTYQRFSHH